MPETESTTHVTGIGRVMVPVTDQDRAIEFYTEKLGFEKNADVPFGDGNRWVEVIAGGNADVAIALVQPRPDDPIGIDTHIALTTGDADAAHEALRSAGVDVDDEVSRMGGPVPPMFWLRDQDGNTLMLVESQDS
ncbi:MAG: VOC family protein [Thermoleophilaceae bacterium]